MSNTLTEWCAVAQVTFKGGNDAWAIMLPNENVLLCMSGEACVEFTPTEISAIRSLEGWQLSLISRGMMGEAVEVFSEWLASLSEKAPTLALTNQETETKSNEN